MRVAGNISVAIALVVGLCYLLLMVLAATDVQIKEKPDLHKYRYIARMPDGHMLVDEKGHALLFDSRKAADSYAKAYQSPPSGP